MLATAPQGVADLRYQTDWHAHWPPFLIADCSSFEFDRFMRFMERYAEDKGLGFTKVR